MSSWGEFDAAAPDFAAAGQRLFRQAESAAWIAMMATVSRDGTPRMAPVCPILAADALYISAGGDTPKVRDLQHSGRYALHAFLGASDEEFQLQGTAELVADASERRRVHDAIPFQYDADDPVFRLEVTRCLWVYWVKPGQPGTYPVKKRWPDR